MTALELSVAVYWRASRVLRGQSYGTPLVADSRLHTLAKEIRPVSAKLATLAYGNSESRYAEPKACKVVSIA